MFLYTNWTVANTIFLTQLKKQPKITSRKWQSTSHLIHFHGFIFCCWEWVQMDIPVPSSQGIVFVMKPLCGLHLLLMPLNHHHQESHSPSQWLTMQNTVCLLLLEQQRQKWSRYFNYTLRLYHKPLVYFPFVWFETTVKEPGDIPWVLTQPVLLAI